MSSMSSFFRTFKLSQEASSEILLFDGMQYIKWSEQTVFQNQCVASSQRMHLFDGFDFHRIAVIKWKWNRFQSQIVSIGIGDQFRSSPRGDAEGQNVVE